MSWPIRPFSVLWVQCLCCGIAGMLLSHRDLSPYLKQCAYAAILEGVVTIPGQCPYVYYGPSQAGGHNAGAEARHDRFCRFTRAKNSPGLWPIGVLDP